MSNITTNISNTGPDLESPCDGVRHILEAPERDLGGFSVRRFLPHTHCRSVGPFVFFDQMGPAQFAPDTGIDVRPHPHIGLATITYLFEGEMTHRDSLGNEQVITPGAVNWMTAGCGIVHSERTGQAARKRGQNMHGLQIWVALPDQHEETAPAFQHVSMSELPVIRDKGTQITLIAGKVFAKVSPVTTLSPLYYLDAQLRKQSFMNMPEDYTERGCQVINGRIQIADRVVEPDAMVIFEPGRTVEVSAVEDSRLVLFGGEPVGERYLWWNFVSSSMERIEQAKQQWKTASFPAVPGDTEFIPLPE